MTEQRGYGWRLAVPMALTVGVVGLWWVLMAARASSGDAARLPVLGQVGPFSLTERSGRVVTEQTLRGQVWLADCIFTYCAGPCPQMTAKMAELQRTLGEATGVTLVTVTVDPDRDTPEVLRAYAQQHGADAQRWLFLTGEAETVRRLVVEGFKMGNMEEPMNHSTHFVLIDADGSVRGYYDSGDPDAMSRVERDVRSLSRIR